MKRLLLNTLVCLSLSSTALSAHEYKLGELTIDHPYTRTTPPMAPVGGGFMTITNHGEESATLIGGTAEFAEVVEIHEMEMADNVMKMRRLEKGLEIPAGETVELKPGGYHLMFIKLSEQMKEDDRHKATLKFAKAGEIEVKFVVKDISKMMENMDDKAMKHGDMDHSKHGKMEKKTGDNMDHSTHSTTPKPEE